MNDFISRQAAIELVDWYQHEFSECDYAFGELANELSKLPSAQPEPQWIPCSERLPKRIINGNVETEQEFFVTIKERWPGEEWRYHTDIAWIPGDYIDEYWQTMNDWKEGQEVQVIAWMPLPEPYQEEE